MFFRWVRFQGTPIFTGANDNANGSMFLTCARLRRWHLHTEFLAGTANTISLTYLAAKTGATGLMLVDFAHILENCVVAPSGLNPQDAVLDFGEEGYPLPQNHPIVGRIYNMAIYTSTNTLTGGFLLSELEFTYDFPYSLVVTPTWVN